MSGLEPRRTALLVMDYQPGILERLKDPDALLARAAEAIGAARGAGATVGYVRVAFTDADYGALPPTSAMAKRITSREAMHADAPHTQVHEAVAPRDGDVVVRKVRVGAFSTTDLHVHAFLFERVLPRQATVLTVTELRERLAATP